MMTQDTLKNFPNQVTDGDPQECVALTVSDIYGNLDGHLYDPDFTYAGTLFLEGVQPTTAGSDPFVGMESAVGYGLLNATEETFTARTMGELYASNWANYTPQQKASALKNAKPGFRNISGLGATDYDSIVNFLKLGIGGVSMPMTFFSSFMNPLPGGILPAPSGSTSNHNVAIYDVDPAGNLVGKFWLGPAYGDNGYFHMSKEICNTVCTNIYGPNPAANRWISLLGIAINKGFPYDIIIQLANVK